MVAKVNWLCWTAPWTMCRDVCCNKGCYLGQKTSSRTTLSWSKIMLRPTQSEPLGISWEIRTWKSWIGHRKVQIWTPRTLLGPDSDSYPWHWSSSNYGSTIAHGCAAGLGYPKTCCSRITQIAKFTGPTWGPPGSCRPQMGPMLAPWTLLSG